MSSFEALARPLAIGAVTIRNRVFLAPLSGVSDSAFRARAAAHGAGLVVSEMIASGELARGRSESARRLAPAGDGPHVVQLAGREACWIAEGARIAAGEGAEIVDINMGCPAKKVTGGYCGSALMRDLDHAQALIAAAVNAVPVPVTVKMRLGWDDTEFAAPELARRAEAVGARMVTVHGRTRCQFYKGKADWRAIGEVKQAVTIPVVANGDVASAADAAGILEQSGADAIMIGRAHYGAPWTAGAIAAAAAGGTAPAIPTTPAAFADYVGAHYEAMLSLYGSARGVRHARKHLGWYFDRHAPAVAATDRQAIMTADDPAAVLARLADLFEAGADHGAGIAA
ncbi:MAG: tRNA dihydrouridine synthase DusB [Nitratireductor sp.]